MSTEVPDEDAFALLRAVVAAHDDGCQLWSRPGVEQARSLYVRGRGAVPSIDSIVAEIGEDRAKRMLPDIIGRRNFDNALQGYRSPCHYCGGDKDLVYFEFALMRVESSKVEVKPTLITAAVSLASFPLFGAGAFLLPGRSHKGAALHMKLVVCKPCCTKEGNMFGLFMMNEKRASRHPLWDDLHEHGFTKFLPEDKMPDKFKFGSGRHL